MLVFWRTLYYFRPACFAFAMVVGFRALCWLTIGLPHKSEDLRAELLSGVFALIIAGFFVAAWFALESSKKNPTAH
jgi:hypothetical protein